jgi:hypothetical protein
VLELRQNPPRCRWDEWIDIDSARLNADAGAVHPKEAVADKRSGPSRGG